MPQITLDTQNHGGLDARKRAKDEMNKIIDAIGIRAFNEIRDEIGMERVQAATKEEAA